MKNKNEKIQFYLNNIEFTLNKIKMKISSRLFIILTSFILSNIFFSFQSIAAVKTSVSDEDNIITGIEELGIDSSPKLKLVSYNPSEGTFFRTLDEAETISGVYQKDAQYYDSSLFAKTGKASGKTKAKIFGLDRTNVKNYLGAVFFGIWSFTGTTGEKIEEIEIPVRYVENGMMFTISESEGTRSYKPRMIWKTGHGAQASETDANDGHRYKYVPCNGIHTETYFIKYVKLHQKALWNHFIDASLKITATDKKLDMVGFKLFSSNDACDGCYQSLYELQMNHAEQLSELPSMVGDRPIPFAITFEASTFYHPHNDKIFGSSLFFYPRIIKPLIRLHRENSAGYDCYTQSFGAISEEDIEHNDLFELKEFDQPTFILIKINDGANVRVKLGR